MSSHKGLKQYKRERKKRHKENNPARLLSLHHDNLTSEQRRRIKVILTIRQDNRCAICGIEKQDEGREFAIDHDHLNGHIRGLLCMPCNMMLGFARDDVSLLAAAMRYLEQERIFV